MSERAIELLSLPEDVRKELVFESVRLFDRNFFRSAATFSMLDVALG